MGIILGSTWSIISGFISFYIGGMDVSFIGVASENRIYNGKNMQDSMQHGDECSHRQNTLNLLLVQALYKRA